MIHDTKNNSQTTRELSVTDLKGVGSSRAKVLGKLGIADLSDLLRHFPEIEVSARPTTQISDPGKISFLRDSITSKRGFRLRNQIADNGPAVVISSALKIDNRIPAEREREWTTLPKKALRAG